MVKKNYTCLLEIVLWFKKDCASTLEWCKISILASDSHFTIHTFIYKITGIKLCMSLFMKWISPFVYCCFIMTMGLCKHFITRVMYKVFAQNNCHYKPTIHKGWNSFYIFTLFIYDWIVFHQSQSLKYEGHPENNESCWISCEPWHVAYWNFTCLWYSPSHTFVTKMNAIARRHAVRCHSDWRHILDSADRKCKKVKH